MDISFQEKSAWGLLAGILLVSAFYFPKALAIVEHASNPVALIAVSAIGVVALIIIEAVYHAVIAATGGDARDERDVLIDLRAERVGTIALGIVLFSLIGHIVVGNIMSEGAEPGPLLIAVYLIAALTASEVIKLVTQIWFYRTGS